MNNKKRLIVLILSFVVLIVGASVLYNYLGDRVKPEQIATHNHDHEEHTDTENPAPDFTVTDSAGNKVKLSDFTGKPVILNFWASWCGPCKMEMPAFNEAYNEYKNDIHFLMINMTDGSQETVKTATEFIKDQGYSFPVYFDTSAEAAITYGVTSIPLTIFINSRGSFVAHAQSAIDRETLQKGIDMIYTP